MSDYEKIRLPVQENGGTVWRTVKGKWLVGMSTLSGLPLLPSHANSEEYEKWGTCGWFVISSKSGKLVVYQKPTLGSDDRPTIAVYDSFEAMQPHVPPSIYDEAAERAGVKPPPQFPEIPLEGV